MSRYRITESVGRRVEHVHSYDDLDIHHPSRNARGLQTGRDADFEHGREHARVDGEFEEIRRTNDGRTLVKKDFILSQDSPGRVQIPAPVEGYVHYLPNDPTAALRIYDRPHDQPGAKLVGQVLHMDPHSFKLKEGAHVQYGQPLGAMSDTGTPGSVHAHVEVEADQFKRYIHDIDRGVITPDRYPAKNGQTAEAPARETPAREDGHREAGHREATPRPASRGAAADGVIREGEHGRDVRLLQEQLNKLGYRDGHGHALKSDGDFGDRTREAVKAFQHAHGLKDDGIAGPKTLDALKKAGEAPLLSNPAHPDNGIFRQAVAGLEKLGPNGGFGNREQMERAAAALTYEAKVSGLTEIDHVTRSANGNGLFAVQGELNDPSQNRVHVEKKYAAEQPVERSTFQVQQDAPTREQAQAPQKEAPRMQMA
ncbi:peptidoglycan-binding domain-containing protein [Lysobacter antibioticus]|uniref:Putative peptidoglycan binding domain protein n=1 Tax=Lysobacter antibioticus TaxID=84531 RepID=A0A0S2FAH9_LYSAN|nr:peptidoglycan-binding protein [Lysobacter antibioticus]ALN80549.1 putative peptidoglycan binding domain protein [Lysobacter antibioticus]